MDFLRGLRERKSRVVFHSARLVNSRVLGTEQAHDPDEASMLQLETILTPWFHSRPIALENV